LKFDTQTCPGGGTALLPTSFDVIYTSATTGCTDTLIKGLTIVPPAGPVFTLLGAVTPFQGTITPGPPVTVTVAPASETLTIVNTGNGPLTPLIFTGVLPATLGNGTPGCGRFPVSFSQNPPASLNQCESVTVTIKYNAPTVPTGVTPDQCTVTIQTNAGNKSFTLNGSSQ
jgi:hypothetical protein